MGVVARNEELEAGRRFLAAPGGVRALVLEGEAGVGKTTVWNALIEEARAAGSTVLACRAVAAEATYAFVSLADLLAPLVDELAPSLPEPQRHALDVALLRSAPGRRAINPHAVGAATHALLESGARDRPVVVAIDDAQWLDSATAGAVAFALRRLGAAPVRLLAGFRLERPALPDPLDLEATLSGAVERLRLAPFTLSGLYHLIGERLGTTFPRPTLQRILNASGGNALFALELAGALAEAGAAPAPGEPLPVPETLAGLLEARLDRVDAATREVLLFAALLTSPEVELLRSAHEHADAALGKAVDAGLLRLDGDAVSFSHPLIAAALHASARPEVVRALHARCAAVARDPEERARHLALAGEASDDSTIRALEDAAGRADARGAPESAAELVELALALAPDPDRELALARYLFRAGDAARALALAERLHAELPAGGRRALVSELLVHLAHVAGTDEDAVRFAEQAIEEADLDPATRARLYVTHARVTGDDEAAALSLRCAFDLLDAQADPDPVVRGQALTAAIGARVETTGELPDELVEQALDLERRAADPYVSDRVSASVGFWLKRLGDLNGARPWLERTLRSALDEGDESSLPYALSHLAQLELLTGHCAAAEARAREHLATAEAAGQRGQARLARMNLAATLAHVGRVDDARAEATFLLAEADAADDQWDRVNALGILGLVELSVGDARAAAGHLERLLRIYRESHRRDPLRAHADYVEALVELGDHQRADEVADLLRSWSGETGPAPLRAVASRAVALAAAARDLDVAASEVEHALALHEHGLIPFDLARTLLVAGQIRRRRGERRLARDAFERAGTTFAEIDAPLWAARAADEARRVPIRRGAAGGLTPAEQQVAELVAAGRTTREVAAELFVSPKTVEANLTRIYRKLGIRSRAELGAEMALRAKP